MSADIDVFGLFLQRTQSLLHNIGVCVTDKRSQGMTAHIVTTIKAKRQILRQVGL